MKTIGLHLQVDADLHQAIKIAAAEKRVTLRDFVEKQLRKAIANKGSKS